MNSTSSLFVYHIMKGNGIDQNYLYEPITNFISFK